MITDESREDEDLKEKKKNGRDSIGDNKSKSKGKDKLDRVDSKTLRMLAKKKIKVSLSGVTKLKRRPS